MSDIAEIKGLVEGINPIITELRGEVETLKDEKKDFLTQAKWDKMTAEITGKMETLQTKQAALEAAANRPGASEADEAAAERKAAFVDFLRKGEGGMTAGGGSQMEIKAMSTDVNPDGGFLVYPELSSTVVGRVFESDPVRQLANVESTTSTSIEMLIDDGEAGARWVSEGASGGETDTPQVGRKVIAVHKMEADPKKTTEQVMASYFDVEAWLSGKVSDRFGRLEATAFVLGDGINKPRGFMTYDAATDPETYERNKIRQINMGAAAALTADGLIDVQNSLKEEYQGGATWAC